MTTQEAVDRPRRRPGNSAGITRERIVAAARPLDPETLTIQAVATKLGVDRKAVVYHVTDRDGLMELLAIDAFSKSFADTDIPNDATWQEAMRLFAESMRAGLLASGPLVTYFRIADPSAAASLVSAELVLERMIGAGMSPQTAGRSMIVLANLAMSYARDVALTTDGTHPQSSELHRFLTAPEGAVLTAIRTLDEMPVRADDHEQFEFAIDVLIRGIEQRVSHD